MKIPKRLVILSSVLLFALTGCGIPSILYMSTSDYTFTKTTNETYSVGISSLYIAPTDTTLVDQCYGPSVILMYTMGPSDDSSSIQSSAISKFRSEHIQNSYYGVPVATQSGTPNKIFEYSYTSNSTTVTRGMFLFSTQGTSNTQVFSAPDYNIYRNYHLAATTALSNAVMTLTDITGGGKYFTLTHADTHYDLASDSLYRYNGKAFVNSGEEIQTDDLDYYNQVKSSETAYVYVFAAFCVTPNSSSTFSNIFMSEAKFLGSIAIN